jgi:hypothetical protein
MGPRPEPRTHRDVLSELVQPCDGQLVAVHWAWASACVV